MHAIPMNGHYKTLRPSSQVSASSVQPTGTNFLRARTICIAFPATSRRWRGHSSHSEELLCQYHSQLHLQGHRSPCPRKCAAPHPGGWRAPIHELSQQSSGPTCEAAGSASLGPQPAPWPSSSSSPWTAALSHLATHLGQSARQLLSGLGCWGPLARAARFLHYYREVLLRAALTVGMLTVIRAGHFIPMPGIDLTHMPALSGATAGERLIKALYGQAQDLPASLFDLGISPFVNASILLALTLLLPPEAAQLPGMGWLGRVREGRKEGRTGEAAINGTMNLIALAIAVYLGLIRAFELESCAVLGGWGGWFLPRTVLSLVAGSAIMHMCASTITAFGLGNGSSLVICSSIISEYAATLHTVLAALDASLLGPPRLAALLAGYLALVAASVWLATSELRLQVVQYATSAPPPPSQAGDGRGGGGMQDLVAQARILALKKSSERSQRGAAGRTVVAGAAAGTTAPAGGGSMALDAASASGSGGSGGGGGVGGVRTSEYFPLQLNSSGLMSIVLGGAAYFGFLPKLLELAGGSPAAVAGLSAALMSPAGLVGYGLTVAALEFLPLGGVNPKEIAEVFNTMNVGLKGVVPGEPTERELNIKLLQCKFWGGACLGTLAVAAQLYDMTCTHVLGTSLGTTSLLVIVGAVLQTARQVEGLLEGPKLQRKLDQERAAIQSLSLL